MSLKLRIDKAQFIESVQGQWDMKDFYITDRGGVFWFKINKRPISSVSMNGQGSAFLKIQGQSVDLGLTYLRLIV